MLQLTRIPILLLLSGTFACSSADGVTESSLDTVNTNCLATASKPENDAVHVLINVGSGRALDINSALQDQGTSAIQWDYNGGLHQHFRVHNLGTGYATLQAQHSQQMLDVKDNLTTAGAPIQQWSANGYENQNWQLASTGNGQYRIVSQRSRLVLSVAQDNKEKGATIIQDNDHGSVFQRWMIVPLNKISSCQGNAKVETLASGFATGTTGGGNTSVTTVQNCKQLVQKLESKEPAVVHLNGVIDCRVANRTQAACAVSCGRSDPGKYSYRVPVGNQTCTELGSETNATVQRTRNERRIAVTSNKTILGVNANAKILGASLDMSGSSNIILRNLTLEDINPGLIEAGDGITLSGSQRIWIDHLRFTLISDGYVDIKNSTGITLSYNHLVGRNPAVCGGQHHYTSMVQDSQVTFHHNVWDSNSGRNPKLLGAQTRAHLYNNLWKNISYFAINTNEGAQAKVEGNVFDNARKPHWNEKGTGLIEAEPHSNRYLGASNSSKEPRDHTGTVFSDIELYPYSLDSMDSVQQNLPSAVGPRN